MPALSLSIVVYLTLSLEVNKKISVTITKCFIIKYSRKEHLAQPLCCSVSERLIVEKTWNESRHGISILCVTVAIIIIIIIIHVLTNKQRTMCKQLYFCISV